MVLIKQQRRHWRHVGWGRRQGFGCRVYEPRTPTTCADCGRAICVGERFTRHTLAGRGTPIVPLCGTCRPFIELGA